MGPASVLRVGHFLEELDDVLRVVLCRDAVLLFADDLVLHLLLLSLKLQLILAHLLQHLLLQLLRIVSFLADSKVLGSTGCCGVCARSVVAAQALADPILLALHAAVGLQVCMLRSGGLHLGEAHRLQRALPPCPLLRAAQLLGLLILLLSLALLGLLSSSLRLGMRLLDPMAISVLF